MKKILLPILALIMASQVFASSGKKTIHGAELNELHHQGEVILEETNVKKIALIDGLLVAHNSKFNDLTIRGQTELDKCVVRGALTVQGRLNMEDTKVQGAVNVSGNTEIEESHIDGTVAIAGHTEIEHATFNQDVSISGDSKIEESHFKHNLNCNGNLEVSNSRLEANVTHKGKILDLEDTSLKGNLTIEKLDNDDRQQILNLENSHIMGNVHFASGKGKIIKDEASTIKGKVTGAQVNQKG